MGQPVNPALAMILGGIDMGGKSIPSEERCNYCGMLGWTVHELGAVAHKHDCPHRVDTFCQAHPLGCDHGGDQRGQRVVPARLTP